MFRGDGYLQTFLETLEERLDTSNSLTEQEATVSLMFTSGVNFSDFVQFYNVKKQRFVYVDFFEFREKGLRYDAQDLGAYISGRFPALSRQEKELLTTAFLIWVGAERYAGSVITFGGVLIETNMSFTAFFEAVLGWLNKSFAGRGLVFIAK